MKTLELWGGYECTVNRIGDRWRDQTIFSGHEDRSDDIELFASLGMKSLRYPALWERVSPDCPEQQDFRWTDERLAEMRRLGINPILTLCHHGSGPHYTSLVDPSFATGLASHAAAVARRYP
jgi:dTDP-4-dehydrorhamnose reductase